MSCCDWPLSSGVEPGWNQVISTTALNVTNDANVELVTYNLPQSQQAITIPFTVTKASANYLLFGATIYNLVDSSVLTGITFTPTTFSTTSVTGLLSGTVNTANYYIKFIVAVTGQ